jgi:hypothetical protein
MTPSYVPAPEVAKTDYQLGVHYFPGWKEGTHYGWGKITPYPDRKPLLGWYDEGSPEVADWEIKWALEHGISYFVYCWYRDGNEGPVKQRLGHAIHDGLLKARFLNLFKFCIMWENQNAGCASENDLLENLLPYLIDNYFSHPSYLKIDGKPVLCVYDPNRLMECIGANEKVKRDAVRRVFDRLRSEILRRGFPGIWLFCECRHDNAWQIQRIKDCGFDYLFAYCWHPASLCPSREEAIAMQIEHMRKWIDLNIIPFVPTISAGWDPMPWQSDNPKAPWLNPDKMTRWHTTPSDFEDLCRRVKEMMATLPKESLGRKMALLDNWNEWGEGHFIAPHVGNRFGHLDAVRNVFTSAPRNHKDLTPVDVGRGPYDSLFKSG